MPKRYKKRIKTVDELYKELLSKTKDYKQIKKSDILELARLLNWIDRACFKAYDLFHIGVGLSLHFHIEDKLNVPESLKKITVEEIKKRDSGTPKIDWYNGHLSYVTIMNPWG